jgi:4-nitrophenyl phosphatase
MYRGREAIPEAIAFVKQIQQKGLRYVFVTNNSSKTPETVAEHLNGMGFDACPEDVLTASLAAAQYLSEKTPHARLYVIGEEGLKTALRDKGFELTDRNPDAVIIGIDRNIHYEKLAKACLAIRGGAAFYSTNSDAAVPTEKGLLPGNGALTAAISYSTQKEPVFIGKPHTIIMEQAHKVLGTPKEETIMIGDNYDTDILAGIRYGIDTLLVHTGVTSPDMLTDKQPQPTYAASSLANVRLPGF